MCAGAVALTEITRERKQNFDGSWLMFAQVKVGRDERSSGRRNRVYCVYRRKSYAYAKDW